MEFASLRHSAPAVQREIPACIREALTAAQAGALLCYRCRVRPPVAFGRDGSTPLCRSCRAASTASTGLIEHG